MDNISRKSIAFIIIIIVNISSVFSSFTTYSYPNGFIDDENNFAADIVIGAKSTEDVIAANLLINILTTNIDDNANNNINDNRDDNTIETIEESEELYSITYRRSESNSGDRVNIAKGNSDLNYGETLEEVSQNDGLDDTYSNFLEDKNFDNGIDSTDYTQNLKLLNGEFNYALRDDVSGIEEITNGIYYENNRAYAQYIIDMDTSIDLEDTDDLDEDMVGKTLTFFDSEYTIVEINNDDKDLDYIELIGGSNKFTIEEGETRKITVDNEDYEITVNVVTKDKISLIVNEESNSIDIFDVEDIGSVTIAVTDLIDSNRDSINGFAELVVGGRKIRLEDNNAIIQINDEDIDDIYDDFEATSDFNDGNTGLETITITYRVNEDTLLEEGDYLEDILFNQFIILYDGTNDVEYSKLAIESDDETVSLEGTLFTNNILNREIIFTTSTTGANGETYIKGENDDDRIFIQNSDLDLFMPNGFTRINNDVFEIDFSNSLIRGSGILLSEDTDNQFWYEITSVDSSENEIDFEEIFDEKVNQDIKPSDFEGELDINLPSAVDDDIQGTLQLDTTEFGTPIIAFENDYILDLTNIESTGVSGYFTLYYDGDINADEALDEEERYNLTLDWNTQDDRIEILIDENDNDFVNSNNADKFDDNDDKQVYVTRYGTKLDYNSEDRDEITIQIPNEQLYANAYVIFGESDLISRTTTVRASELDDKIEELEDDGYEIIQTKKLDSTDNGKVVKELPKILLDDEITILNNKIIIGGPAINEVAAQILGVEFPTYGPQSELLPNEAVIRFYDNYNTLLIYGYEYKDTQAAVQTLIEKESVGQEVFVSN